MVLDVEQEHITIIQAVEQAVDIAVGEQDAMELLM